MMTFKVIYRSSQATNAEIVRPKAKSLSYMVGMPKHVSKVKDGRPYGEINNSKADQEEGLEIDPVDRITGTLYMPCPLAYLPTCRFPFSCSIANSSSGDRIMA
jgi:hypothetical protein